MKTLFDKSVGDKMIARINKLTPDSKAQWGKMTVSQMLAHATEPFKTASGELKIKRMFVGRLFGGFAKRKFIIGDEPFGHNSPTAKEFIMTGIDKNFEDEKAKLIERVNLFTKAGQSGITSEPHTFFGNLSPEEWGKLMTKHLDHHLTQFGV